MAFIRVTKLDAAVHQLRTAIQLWFHDGDPVSIQTLLAAAHEIIHVLSKRQGLEGLLFDLALIKKEYRTTVAQSIKSLPNFFKHARNDPEGEIEFNTQVNFDLMCLLVAALQQMKHPQGMEEETVVRWLLVHQPDFLISPEGREPAPADELEQIKRMSKTEFFRMAELHWRG